MLHYILQVVVFQLVFLIIYDAFLRKETFFNLNRVYILVTALLSVVIPFIKIDQIKTVVAKDFVIRLPEVIIGDTSEAISTINPQIAIQAGINLEPEPVSIWNAILISGMCLALLVLLFKISKLVWLAQKHPRQWKGNLLIIELINSTKAFSFFHYIFLGEKLNIQEKQAILEHEIVHVTQKHTLDLLFFELFRIVFWFNPLVYMYQNRIATVHEYIADAKAVKQNNKTDYYNNLLSQVFETEKFSFVNPFFKHSLIKKRILMLSKSKSKQIQLLKYALLIPIVFTMLIYTSSYAQEKIVPKTNSEIVHQDLTDEQLKKKLYDEIVEMKTSGKTNGEIANFVLEGEDKYIMTRVEYYRLEMFIKYMSDESRKIKLQNGDLSNVKEEPDGNVETQKTYTEYLEWKTTDEAKVAWENNARDGVLRMVFDDLGNWTEEEEKKFNEKLDLVEKDNDYKELLVTAVDGRTKMVVNDVKSSEESKTFSTRETQIMDGSAEIPFATVDEVPTFAFCDTFTTQVERKKCMTEHIAKHVNQNFNTDVATTLGLVGRQRINVIFKIDKDGFITGAKARASHPKLEEEAIRVINTLPQFIAGKHKGVPVTVPYSLPIIFQVHSDTISDDQDAIPVTNAEDAKLVIEDNKRGKAVLNEVPFMRVDEVPMYESCLGLTSQKDKRACVSKEISSHFNRNFNTNLGSKLGLNGRMRIAIVFKIDQEGYVTQAQARAPHPQLEKEAIRVAKSLPKFIPGKHNGEPVVVPYSIPVLFNIVPGSNQKIKN